jgi:hypothetical protein
VSIRDLPRWTLPAALGVAVVVILLVVVLSGGDDETAEGPSAVVPADAPVYLDLTLRPEGDAKEAADAALGTILDSDDPGTKLVSLIEQEAEQHGDEFDYSEDIEPWLGERFAVFLTTIGGDRSDSEGGFIIETTDPEQALDFVDSQRDEGEATADSSYKGIKYEIDPDGQVIGHIGDFLVGGDEPAFKAAVDASKGDSLAESSDFNDALDELDPDRLATMYVPVKQFLASISSEELDPQALALINRALGDAAEAPVLGQVTASENDVSFELSAGGGSVETEESSLLEDLPADTWFALGIGDIGGAIDGAIDAADEGGIDSETVKAQIESQTGIEVDALTAALGEGALYVNGTSKADLGGALIIQDKDETVTANLLDRLEDLINQRSQGQVKVKPIPGASAGFQLVDPSGRLQKPIQVVQSSGKIVIGYGPDSVLQAGRVATAASTLGEEPSFSAAREAVGALGVDAFFSIEPILQLAESEGVAEDPDYETAKPYLDDLDFLALGSGSNGDRNIVRFILGIR